MATSMRLSPQEVTKALQILNDEKTKELVFYLGVDLHVLENIETRFSGGMRRIHYVQVWMDNDPEASWSKIVSGLKQIGMNALAKQVTTRHCQPHQPASLHTLQPTTSPAQLAVPSPVVFEQPVTSHHTVAPTSTETPATSEPAVTEQAAANVCTVAPTSMQQTATSDRTQPVALCMRSVANVKATKRHLEKTFSDLITRTRSTLCARERHNHEFLDEFRDHLLVLPVAKKAIHVKFFLKSENDILDAKSIRKLFAILSRYWSYRNYEILHEIVDSFCSDQLQERMREYCMMLEEFEMATTVDVYLTAIPNERDEELDNAFSKMVVKINRPLSECTLYELRTKTQAIMKESSLHPHSVYIGAVSSGCVEVVVRFPTSAVGWVLGAMTPRFIHTHHLTEVAVDGERLNVYKTERDELNDELITASEAGDVVRVVSLLNSGADINTVDRVYSRTALDCASWKGHLQVVRLLLHRGAEVECRDQDEYTPLISAAWQGRCDVVIDLLDSGAEVNAQMNGGDSALMMAAWCGYTETVTELVKAKANLDLQNNDGNSVLMRAAYYGHTETIRELVKAKANLDLQNDYGDSALMIAASGGYTETVAELVKAKANLDLQNNRGDSAVIQATVEHESDVVRVLVGAGSDLNLQNEEGLTALMITARSGRSDITDILLEGEHIDLDIQKNSTGWSALFFSAERGDVATTQSLLTAGANVHLKDENGLTVLEVARASADKDWSEEDGDSSDDDESSYHHVHESDRVIKLLSTYILEPSSRPVSLAVEYAENTVFI